MALQQPQITQGRSRISSLSAAGISPEQSADRESAGHNPPQKWGSLANIPLAPRFLKDTYSDMTHKFEMGDEPDRVKGNEPAHVDSNETIASSSTSSSSFKLQKEAISWPGGRPPKGIISWVGDEQFVVVGAGRDAIWELFTLGEDRLGNKGMERLGWKRYMEDEGLD
jgi:hypothetical protein